MAIAITLKEYLAKAGVPYKLLLHYPTNDSSQTAKVAHIPREQLAKAVMLEDENGRYLMAVISSDHHVDFDKLYQQHRIHLDLATETELGKLFNDCELGAVPPVGNAYGIDVMLDASLDDCPDVYFEGGDHVHLVHLSGSDFRQLLPKAIHADIAMS